MDEFTPEQKNQLRTWAGQRDVLLGELINIRTIKEKEEKQVADLSKTKGFVTEDINHLLGRLEELTKKEKEFGNSISSEISKKLLEKAILEGEVTNLKKQVILLEPQKEALKNDITMLTETFKTISSRVGVLDKVVDHVTRVSEYNANHYEVLISHLTKHIEDLISVTKKTAGDTDMVMKELPKVFFEVQRASLQKHKING